MARFPVAIIIFNRLEHTRRLLAALSRVRPQSLYVIADGPRDVRDKDPCAAVRALIDEIDWPCNVEKDYAETNLGCRRRVETGLDWVFSQVGEAIILEDDVIPDPSFFPYCEELLERYRGDSRVHTIRGFSALGKKLTTPSSYYLSRWHSIWGWATWDYAWEQYDGQMAAWPDLRNSGWLEELLPEKEMVSVMRYLFDMTHANPGDEWGNQWAFAGLKNRSFALAPTQSLTTNIGFGVEGTHLKNNNHPRSVIRATEMQFPLKHPDQLEINHVADMDEWSGSYLPLRRRLRRNTGLRGRLIKKFRF